MAPFGQAIEAAYRAHAAVALKNTFAKVAGIAAQLPFLDAPIRAERQPPRRNFQIAPAAKATPIRPLGQTGTVRTASRHGALFSHQTKYSENVLNAAIRFFVAELPRQLRRFIFLAVFDFTAQYGLFMPARRDALYCLNLAVYDHQRIVEIVHRWAHVARQ